MLKRVIKMVAVLCLTLCCALSAKETHLFILSGQSNMARLNPDISFTPAVNKKFGAANVVVAKNALGSMPILQWYKKWKPAKGTAPEQTGLLYGKLLKSVKEALGDRKATTVTFVWMQGERDAAKKWHEVYGDSLKGVVEQLRQDLKHPQINVVIGRLSDSRSGNASWDAIRKIQQEVCEADKSWEMVDTDDLNGPKNGLHYTKDGYKKLGERFAEKAIALISK